MPLSMPQTEPQMQSYDVKSGLQDYMDKYSSKLSSMMGGAAPLAPTAAPAGPMAQAPQSQLEMGPPTPQAQPAQEASSPDHEASFRSKWKATPEKEQTAQVDDLDETLKKGGQTIDSAYDEMTQQLGHRPDGSLSRKEKGMMLMEFGLNLMANSAGSAYGEDTGGAIGDAGAKTLANYRSRLEGSQAAWDKRAGDIAGRRGDAKADLGKQGVLESSRDRRASALENSKSQLAEERDIRREEREGSQLSGTITDPSNKVFGYNKRGEGRSLLDENGKPIRERQSASGLGAGGKGFEKQWLFDEYMKANGTGKDGKPLTGAALTKVKNDALKYAGGLMKDTRTANQKNIEDLMERGVPQSVAGDIIYKLKDNPQKMQAALASALARTGMLEPEEIADQARAITESIVGQSQLESAGAPKIPNQPAPAPARAIEALKANPKLAPDFQKKYGYLPEGFSQLQ